MRADRLLEPVVNAYRGFDAPLGARFEAEGLHLLLDPTRHAGLSWWQRRRADLLGPEALEFGASSRGRGLFQKRPQGGIVGVREAADVLAPARRLGGTAVGEARAEPQAQAACVRRGGRSPGGRGPRCRGRAAPGVLP